MAVIPAMRGEPHFVFVLVVLVAAGASLPRRNPLQCAGAGLAWRVPMRMPGPIVPAITPRARERALRILWWSPDLFPPGEKMDQTAAMRARFDSAFGKGADRALLALALDTTVSGLSYPDRAARFLAVTEQGLRLIDSTLFRLASDLRHDGVLRPARSSELFTLTGRLVYPPAQHPRFRAVGAIAAVCALRAVRAVPGHAPEAAARLRLAYVAYLLAFLERQGEGWSVAASEDVLMAWPSKAEASYIRHELLQLD